MLHCIPKVHAKSVPGRHTPPICTATQPRGPAWNVSRAGAGQHFLNRSEAVGGDARMPATRSVRNGVGPTAGDTRVIKAAARGDTRGKAPAAVPGSGMPRLAGT